MFSRKDNVADDCASRRQRARAPAVKHDLANAVARDLDGIERVVDRSDHGIGGNECGMHANLYAGVGIFADRKQFDFITEFFAVGDIFAGDFRNAFPIDVFQRNTLAERKGRKNRELIRRVEAFDVRRRIKFGIAEVLCFFKRGLVIRALFFHFRENIIGRAVDDAHQRKYAVRLRAFGQRADNGHAAHAARFEKQTRVHLFRLRFQLVPVFAHEFLVGSNNGFARHKRF